MYEVTLYVGTQAVAGFDNLTRWADVKGAVIGFEGKYDLNGYDTRCVVRFSDTIRTVTGWVNDSVTMERPLLIEGLYESNARYSCLVWDTENAERIADDLPFSRVYDLTTEHYDVFPAYVGGYDRDMSRLLQEPVTGKLLPF